MEPFDRVAANFGYSVLALILLLLFMFAVSRFFNFVFSLALTTGDPGKKLFKRLSNDNIQELLVQAYEECKRRGLDVDEL
jgi:hypothetical protein